MDDQRRTACPPRARRSGSGCRVGSRTRRPDGGRARQSPPACREPTRIRVLETNRVNVVYDAGMLMAADRNDRQAWADHRVRLELGLTPIVAAPVVAQTSRSPRQAQLRRLLRGCEIVPFAPEEAHRVGSLLDASHTSDVVDAHVAILAFAHKAMVITSDDGDLARLSACLPTPIDIEHI